MNFIYKTLFALPNSRPYTKYKKRIIPEIITGSISSLFLLLYYTPNSLCRLDGGPPTKALCQKLGVLQKVGGPPQWLRPWRLVQRGRDWAGPLPARLDNNSSLYQCTVTPIDGQYTNHRIASGPLLCGFDVPIKGPRRTTFGIKAA